MFFRPSFCANCGERIERLDWGLMVSRRFCQVCESEFKGQDLIPRFVVGISLLIGLFGVGSYLKSGTVSADQRLAQARPVVDRAVRGQPSNAQPLTVEGKVPVAVPASPQPKLAGSLQAPASTQKQPVIEAASDPVYFCGAQTKKGTPCSRRVKGNTRCFQHLGMPAMLSADKLKIN